jgi:hypothetical protein
MTNVEVTREKRTSEEAKVGDILISPDNKLFLLMIDHEDFYRLVAVNNVRVDDKNEAGTYTAGYASLSGIREIIGEIGRAHV